MRASGGSELRTSPTSPASSKSGCPRSSRGRASRGYLPTRTDRLMPCQIVSSSVPTSAPGWNAQNAALKAPTLVPTSRSGTSPARASTSITPTWNAPRLAPPLNTTARPRGRVGCSQDQGRLGRPTSLRVPFSGIAAFPCTRRAIARGRRTVAPEIAEISADGEISAAACRQQADRRGGRCQLPGHADCVSVRPDAAHHGHDASRAHDGDPGGAARRAVGAGAGDLLAKADRHPRRAIDPDQPRRSDLCRRRRQGADPRDPPARRLAGGDGADDAHHHRRGGPMTMEFRQLGGSGFRVPVLSLGTGTFGGRHAASATTPAYPYWHQRQFAERNPPPV